MAMYQITIDKGQHLASLIQRALDGWAYRNSAAPTTLWLPLALAQEAALLTTLAVRGEGWMAGKIGIGIPDAPPAMVVSKRQTAPLVGR